MDGYVFPSAETQYLPSEVVARTVAGVDEMVGSVLVGLDQLGKALSEIGCVGGVAHLVSDHLH